MTSHEFDTVAKGQSVQLCEAFGKPEAGQARDTASEGTNVEY